MSGTGPAPAMLEVEHLGVTFGHGASTVHAVRDVSFRVAEGAAFGLVGESGSGKSTVLRAVSGLVERWDGHIRVAGPALGRRRARGFYKLCQMVFQDPYASLHPRHTVDRLLSEPIARFPRISPSSGRPCSGRPLLGRPVRATLRAPGRGLGGTRDRAQETRCAAPTLRLRSRIACHISKWVEFGSFAGEGTTVTIARSTLVGCAFLSDIRVWEAELKTAARRWLRNFTETEQDYAATLLDAFVFFSDELVDRLFVAAFDALAAEVTEQDATYSEKKDGWQSFIDQVLITHPTGEMPNVTDSGYAFNRRARQRLGVSQAHILEAEGVIGQLMSGVTRPVVFVDDFVGSGDQFCKTWHREYDTARGRASFAALVLQGVLGPFYYCPLVCTQYGLSVINADCPGLKVRPTHLLPSEYSANHPASLLWPDGLRAESARFVEETSDRARIPVGKRWGYANLGLALAFQHGVPDATLPILWWEDNGWIPLLRRR